MSSLAFETTDIIFDPECAEHIDVEFEFSDMSFTPDFGAAGGFGTLDYEQLFNKPKINHVELVGDKTLAELGVGDLIDGKISEAVQTYVHNQLSAASTWIITHNLGRMPAVTTVDSSGTVVLGEVSYTDSNTVCIFFSSPFSGRAYLN